MSTTKRAPGKRAATANYDESNVKNHQFPESVRARPTQVIGPLGQEGVFTITREILDNVVDEALAGRCTALYIHIDPKTFTYTVMDNGAGIPVGMIKVPDALDKNKVHSVSALRAITGLLQTSGKFDDKAYATSRGTHGLGAKCTNALSETFTVFTCRSGVWHSIKYAKGHLVAGVAKVRNAPINPISGKPMLKGTFVRFTPDKSILGAQLFPMDVLKTWAEVAALFTPGLGILLAVATPKGLQTKKYYSAEGPVAFLRPKVAAAKAAPLVDSKTEDELAGSTFEASNALVDCAVVFTSWSGDDVSAYTNGLCNREGGTHLSSFYKALRDSLTPFLKRGQEVSLQSLKEGVIGIVNAKMSHPSFTSQDKVRLSDERAGAPIIEFLTKEFSEFFKRNRALASAIIEQAMASAKMLASYKLDKEAARNIKKIVRQGFPSKAKICPSCKPAERELYICEGDSAGGTSKIAHDAYFQEIYPIRGKIMNVERASGKRATANEEVQGIFALLGYNPSVAEGKDPLEKLRVSKLIFMADPDVDGPLPGETEVWVRLSDAASAPPILMTMAQLAEPDWFDREYYVYSHNGSEMTWVPATNCRVQCVLSTWSNLVLDNGMEQECSPTHRWLSVLRGEPPGTKPELRATSELSTGDRICFKPEQVVRQGLVSGAYPQNTFREAAILRVETILGPEPTPFYCLTVPTFHTFMLGNEMMSGNCHINSLLLTLVAKYAPSLFERGMVYIAHVDEYYAYDQKTREIYTAMTPQLLQTKLTQAGKRLVPKHIKGYGEVPAEVLEKLSFDKTTRRLLRVVPEDPAMKEFRLIMGNDAKVRREMIGVE